MCWLFVTWLVKMGPAHGQQYRTEMTYKYIHVQTDTLHIIKKTREKERERGGNKYCSQQISLAISCTPHWWSLWFMLSPLQLSTGWFCARSSWYHMHTCHIIAVAKPTTLCCHTLWGCWERNLSRPTPHLQEWGCHQGRGRLWFPHLQVEWCHSERGRWCKVEGLTAPRLHLEWGYHQRRGRWRFPPSPGGVRPFEEREMV